MVRAAAPCHCLRTPPLSLPVQEGTQKVRLREPRQDIVDALAHSRTLATPACTAAPAPATAPRPTDSTGSKPSISAPSLPSKASAGCQDSSRFRSSAAHGSGVGTSRAQIPNTHQRRFTFSDALQDEAAFLELLKDCLDSDTGASSECDASWLDSSDASSSDSSDDELFRPQAPPPRAFALPPGWRCRWDGPQGRYCYINTAANTAQWHPPSPRPVQSARINL